MAQLLCTLLFTIIGAYTCAAVTEMPEPGDVQRMRRSATENWPSVFPDSIVLIGGVYRDRANGVYKVQGVYNDRPIYKGGRNNAWSVYYRKAGYWVLDFNDVSEKWSGTVAIQKTLFASEV